MINDVARLLDEYTAWLRDKTALKELSTNTVEITTPYLDRHNDYIQIYAERENSGYILTDDGYTIDDLRLSGCNLDSNRRQDLLKMTLNGFGVKLEDHEIVVRATPQNFALRKHSLVQAILAVNDLFYLAAPTVAGLFLEDVTSWLDLREVRYSPKVKFTGKSGFDHLFHFLIPKSKSQPERILQAINRPDRDNAEALAFAWIDVRETRPDESQAFAILNDTDRPVSDPVIEALGSYDIRPILWSHREEMAKTLVA